MSRRVLLTIFVVVYLDFFLFMPYESVVNGRIVKTFIIIYLIIALVQKRNKARGGINFKYEILLLAILPLISAFSSYYYRGQPILIGLMVARDSLFWLLYFYLHKYGYSKNDIIKVITIIATISAFIFIFQQVLYPYVYLFNSLQHYDDVEIRQGLYRFRLFPLVPYIYFAFYYYLWKLLKTKRLNQLAWVALFTIAIYLTLTRQIYFCIFIPALFYQFFKKNKVSRKMLYSLITGFVLLYIVYQNLDFIIGSDFVEITKEQGNEDNIRVLSYAFFGLEYWVDEINMIFGNGAASWGNSAYGNEILDIEETKGLYRSDIGIVGLFSMYGVAYIIAVICLYRKFFKCYKFVPVYIRLLVIASIMNLPLACWMENGFFMSMVFYLIDRCCYFEKDLIVAKVSNELIKHNNK